MQHHHNLPGRWLLHNRLRHVIVIIVRHQHLWVELLRRLVEHVYTLLETASLWSSQNLYLTVLGHVYDRQGRLVDENCGIMVLSLLIDEILNVLELSSKVLWLLGLRGYPCEMSFHWSLLRRSYLGLQSFDRVNSNCLLYRCGCNASIGLARFAHLAYCWLRSHTWTRLWFILVSFSSRFLSSKHLIALNKVLFWLIWLLLLLLLHMWWHWTL